MTMTTRSGSVIIYCIALSSLVVIVGYGFLRSTLSDITSGDGGNQNGLAEEAARAGLGHALETIGSGFSAITLLVAGGDGSVSVTISDPPTFLDGPYRAPFVAFSAPNQVGGDFNAPSAQDDLRAENIAMSWAASNTGSWTGDAMRGFHADRGDMIDPTRGRFHEVEYTNLSRPSPAGPSPQPVAPVRFTDLAAAAPQRSEGLFLDRSFVRLATGDPQTDRLRARFRVRYSVSVEDLQGHLLANPDAGLADDFRTAGAGYRTMPPGSANLQHAWYNIASAVGGIPPMGSMRWEHVFLGRGNTSNCDRNPGLGFPSTFPMMFRENSPAGKVAQPWWGKFTLGDAPSGPVERDPRETSGLYPWATAGGGEAVPDGGQSSITRPILHAWTGPQYSWVNLHFAQTGFMDPWEDDGKNYGNPGGSLIDTATLPSPFGHRQVASGNPSGTWSWYEGKTDTPWQVNLLTASPRAIHCMLVAYLPPSIKVLKLTREEFFQCIGEDPNGRMLYTSMKSGAFTPAIDVSLRGRDLFTNQGGAAFTEYQPPVDPLNPGVVPNFQVPDGRSPEGRYPGKLWNDDDSFGQAIDVDSVVPIGRCSHLAQPFIYDFSARLEALASANPVVRTGKPAGWGLATGGRDPKYAAQDRVAWSLDPTVFTFNDSYWWDLTHAFTSAISLVRAEWVQYPTDTINPATAFTPASLRNPAAFTTIEAVDRLFLRQLGEDFDNPAGGTPIPGVLMVTTAANYRGMEFREGSVTASETIRSLVVKDAAYSDKAKVMERVLNDLRLSFLGASPGYSQTFRPFDFDGDGRVQCSCYPIEASASQLDIDNGAAHWRLVDASHALPGRGPAPDDWFSLTGCFFIGKSRFYRVISRGEVFDNLIQTPVADATLETVLVVDPDGNQTLEDTQTLFQRWHHNRINSQLPRYQR